MTKTEAAKQLRANPLLPEILRELEADVVSAWQGATTVEGRERAHADIKALNTLREQIDARCREVLGGDTAGKRNDHAGDGD